MDKIDSFIISGILKGDRKIDFDFILSEEEIPEDERDNIIEYIERFITMLNIKVPQFSFTWAVAHKIKRTQIFEEIIHQILVQGR